VPSPLSRYSDQTQSEQGRLFWGRITEDGYPFRSTSHNPALYREPEYEEKAVRVADFRNGVFDVTSAEDYVAEVNGQRVQVYGNARYVSVMERIINGWYALVYIDRNFSPDKRLKYVEWTEFYMQDGTPKLAPF